MEDASEGSDFAWTTGEVCKSNSGSEFACTILLLSLGGTSPTTVRAVSDEVPLGEFCGTVLVLDSGDTVDGTDRLAFGGCCGGGSCTDCDGADATACVVSVACGAGAGDGVCKAAACGCGAGVGCSRVAPLGAKACACCGGGEAVDGPVAVLGAGDGDDIGY
jgi:hypothetical protein